MCQNYRKNESSRQKVKLSPICKMKIIYYENNKTFEIKGKQTKECNEMIDNNIKKIILILLMIMKNI